jgi:pimeloyl-[acyl-carrier protein] methyl ester esterase
MSPPNEQWLLIRGLTREAGHWRDFPRRFEERIESSKVSFAELPGTGKRFQEKSPDTINAITDSIKRDAQNSPIFLLGISMGAIVATDWAQRYPETLRGVILINPSFSSLSPFAQRLRPANWGKILTAAVRKGVSREKIILEMTSNRKKDFTTLAEEFAEIQRLRPVSRLTFVQQLKAASSFKPKDSWPSVPTLLLNSAGDHLVDPNCSRAASHKWGLDMNIHPLSGHDIPLDNPEWVLDQITSWRKKSFT